MSTWHKTGFFYNKPHCELDFFFSKKRAFFQRDFLL